MLDLKLIRNHVEETEARLKAKDPSVHLAPLLALDEKRRTLQGEVEELKNRRNSLSKKIGEDKRAGKDTSAAMQEVQSFADQLTSLDHTLAAIEKELHALLSILPNLPSDDIKVSPDPADNVCIKEVGKKPSFTFPAKNHLQLNEQLHLFDFEKGAKLSGSGWPTYRGLGARLEWALLQYMVEVHVKNGFEQWMVPFCVRPEIMFGSGQLPKFKDQIYHVADSDVDLYLVPTAEMALNGLYQDEILEEHELPKRLFAYTPCFRREAGAAGRQERGLIRVHQFNKVEMFCFAKPEESAALQEQMVASAEEILNGLNLHYRNMLLVTGDTGFCAAKTIDLEVWLPGQDRYYEVSSVSNCTDFQARRAAIRFRRGQGGKPELVHTLNGSGLATSRLMVALLENNQQADGSVLLPPLLAQRLGVDRLKP
ncbi:MAG: serine--tRNA ligase [Verrucomicrobia bacterium]|nr:serine--tRNA ligase [Verrucomicrobiota bacterium]